MTIHVLIILSTRIVNLGYLTIPEKKEINLKENIYFRSIELYDKYYKKKIMFSKSCLNITDN